MQSQVGAKTGDKAGHGRAVEIFQTRSFEIKCANLDATDPFRTLNNFARAFCICFPSRWSLSDLHVYPERLCISNRGMNRVYILPVRGAFASGPGLHERAKGTQRPRSCFELHKPVENISRVKQQGSEVQAISVALDVSLTAPQLSSSFAAATSNWHLFC